jgi:dihydroxyacetone kinase-like predicted kinase
MILDAIRETGAQEVIVLPNDADSVRAAQAAARTAEGDHDHFPGVRVAVIPTEAQVQGLAALAVHEPGRPFDQDLVEMTAAARHCRSGAVTVAVRQAITSAGMCEPGDVLGAVEGDFVVVGADLYDVAVDVMTRMLGGGGELFTVISGAEDGGLAERCRAYLEATHPTIDVLVYDGGQDRYPLLFGVE